MSYGVIEMQNQLGLKKEELHELFDVAIDEIKNETSNTLSFINNKNIEELLKSLHSIKGIAGNYMIQDLYLFVSDFHNYVKENANCIDWNIISQKNDLLKIKFNDTIDGVKIEFNNL